MHPQCHPQTKLWTVGQLDLGTRWPPAGPLSILATPSSPPPSNPASGPFCPLPPGPRGCLLDLLPSAELITQDYRAETRGKPLAPSPQISL